MSGPTTERDEAPVRLDTSLLDEIRKLRAEVRSAVRSRPTAQLLSKRAAGRIIGIDRDETLGRLIDEGQIKTVLVGQHQRIPLAEVERFVAQGEQRKSRLQAVSLQKEGTPLLQKQSPPAPHRRGSYLLASLLPLLSSPAWLEPGAV